MQTSLLANTTDRTILTVSKLNRDVRNLLEDNFLLVWVEGEISNLSTPGSGHMYFSLKDEGAQVRCALFRMSAQKIKFRPQNGMQVLIRARVSLYEPRGDYQLIAEYMEEAGDGALQRAFEMLKDKLSKEGLFDAAHKKPLLDFPRTIGVITSPTGAAIKDILSVLNRRFKSLPVIVYPVLVQGTEAAKQITQAIKTANARNECDVLLLSRGGGSLEDLWPFNEEIVVRAIYDSDIPIVSGVGHEIDFTIADFVADHRAPTPSAAAELTSPNSDELEQIFLKQRNRLVQSMQIYIRHTMLRLDGLKRRLPHPQKRLQDQAQQLDQLEQRLTLSIQHFLKHQKSALEHSNVELTQHAPHHRIELLIGKVASHSHALKVTFEKQLAHSQQQLAELMRALDNVSPLNTLKRGYAITTHQGKVLNDAAQVKQGDEIETQLVKGKLVSIVKDTLTT